MLDIHDWGAVGEIPKEIYAPAGNAGAREFCVGKPWPEQYLGKCPWGYEPDNFHELVMYEELCRTRSGGVRWGVAGGRTIGLPPIFTEDTAGSDVANIWTSASAMHVGCFTADAKLQIIDQIRQMQTLRPGVQVGMQLGSGRPTNWLLSTCFA